MAKKKKSGGKRNKKTIGEKVVECFIYAVVVVFIVGLIPGILAETLAGLIIAYIAVGMISIFLPIILTFIISTIMKNSLNDEYKSIFKSGWYTLLTIIFVIGIVYFTLEYKIFKDPFLTIVFTVVGILFTYFDITKRIIRLVKKR